MDGWVGGWVSVCLSVVLSPFSFLSLASYDQSLNGLTGGMDAKAWQLGGHQTRREKRSDVHGAMDAKRMKASPAALSPTTLAV
mmetsp:Transcript_19655/g.47645  ORF Transcript_19655/g.47645 Transcript_19655/m.47645 type:complete len:83 (-) Transcript_19655:1205-1453(-)